MKRHHKVFLVKTAIYTPVGLFCCAGILFLLGLFVLSWSPPGAWQHEFDEVKRATIERRELPPRKWLDSREYDKAYGEGLEALEFSKHDLQLRSAGVE